MEHDTPLGDGCSIGVLDHLPNVIQVMVSGTALQGWPEGLVRFESLTVAYGLDDDQDV